MDLGVMPFTPSVENIRNTGIILDDAYHVAITSETLTWLEYIIVCKIKYQGNNRRFRMLASARRHLQLHNLIFL